MNVILYSVPAFFILIFIELIAENLRGTNYYRVNDSLTSLATGSISQLLRTVKLIVPFTVYVFLYEQYSLFELEPSIATWVTAFFLYDFFYYWNHRLGHEVSLLWAAHVVHHSSEEYNLTTALRQTGTSFLSYLFYLPMALMGFDPLILATVGGINLVYQFWVHTQHIGRLGVLDRIFVTPSNHRAHHGQNAIYIDCNYGGVFVLWDRLFGSFQEELDDQPVIFGIRGASNSWNPLWVNMQVYSQLAQDAVHTKSWWYKITIWFRRTGWRPPDVVDQYPLIKTDLGHFEKYDTEVPGAIKLYAIVHYATTAAMGLLFTFAASSMSFQEQCFTIVFVLLSTFSIGVLMENRHYSGVLEWIRWSFLLVFAVLSPIPEGLSYALCGACVISAPLLWLGRLESVRNQATA
ncbi:MAG: alkylglycerol monooxygenase [Cryomorphaceae bacterium]|jgi:alkylglycerol monooxygenase